jgi:AraC-like DNA-binding protein
MTQFTVPTAMGGIARLACARALARGLQLSPLLLKAGLTNEQMEDRNARINVKSQIRLLEVTAAALQDDFLGFHLASEFEPREIGLLYYVLASSDVLDDALRRAERYSAIVNDGIALRYLAGKDAAVTFRYVGVERRIDCHQIEFWVTSLVRICRQLTNRRLMPIRVSVVHNRKSSAPAFKSFFGCDIEFGSNVDEVRFPKTILQLPVVTGDPHLNELLTKYCEEALSHRGSRRGTTRPDLENAIVGLLPHGKARAGEIARKLGMSQRTLARRLASEGLTFAQVLDELKADLAKRYLMDHNLTVSQIAWLLGYREVSAFTHAFKRWAGATPREARSKLDLVPINNSVRPNQGRSPARAHR